MNMPNFAACHQAMRAARVWASRCSSSVWAWLTAISLCCAAHANFGKTTRAPVAAAPAPNNFRVSRREIVRGNMVSSKESAESQCALTNFMTTLVWASIVLVFVEGFGVDSEAVDLREFLFHAVFDGGGDVVNLRDGQIALHGAVAGDQNFVFDEADVHIMAIRKLVKFGGEAVDEIADASGKLFHFFAASDVRAERLDVNVDGGAGAGFVEQILLKFRGEAMRVAKAGALVHFEMEFDEQPAIHLMRG